MSGNYTVVVNQQGRFLESLKAKFDCVESAADFAKVIFDNCEMVSIEITREEDEDE